MNSLSNEEQIEKQYHISWLIIFYKLLFGLVEFLLGFGLTFFSKTALSWYRFYSFQELSEDPHDLLVKLTENVVPNMLTHHTFLSIYLIVLGGAKIAGAIGMLYKQYWGVDLLVGLTFLMLPFQLFQLIRHPSAAECLYVLIGLFIALYLVNFRPHKWAIRVTNKIRQN